MTSTFHEMPHSPLIRCVLSLLGVASLAANAATYQWATGSAKWNSSSPNWTGAGAAWIDGNDAVFNNTSGATVTLSGTRSAASVTLGDALANRSWNFTGGMLSVSGDLTYQGDAAIYYIYSSNPVLQINSAVQIAGDTRIGRANLAITGGTFTTGRIIANSASPNWARLVISGGTVTATGGIDGSTSGSVTFAIDLNGGTLRTPSIRVADREIAPVNNAWMTFNGGTVQTTADNPDFLTLYGGEYNAANNYKADNAYVGNGGAIIDTDGHQVGINANLRAAGSGGLTKRGLGTLTLTGNNTFRGATIIQGGTLRLTRPSLQAAARVEIAADAVLALDFSDSNAVRSLVIGGVSLVPGVYNATTHPGRISGTGTLTVTTGPITFTHPPRPGEGDGISGFRRLKYGYFVTYVLGGTLKSNGERPANVNEMADLFDAPGFAEDLQSMGVEYVIFSAWHMNKVCLWPSTAMERWMPGHTVNRDLLGDMIDAVKAKGIRVLIYTHPRVGHDLNNADQITTGWGGPNGNDPDWAKFDRPKWNNFVNDIYADLINRYGSRIDGLFVDEGSTAGDSWRVVDYPRLRQTIKSRQPNLLMMQNDWGSKYSSDILATEVNYWGAWVPGTNPDNWPASGLPMSIVMGSNWWAAQAPGSPTPRYNATEMFRLNVLRAGVNSTDGGGVNWASGPYAGGGWETGVLEQMQQLGAWIAPIRPSICNTYPSQSWITPPNSTINTLANGITATRSAADGREFVHVLRPPAGNSLTLPAPADGRGYRSASLLENAHPVTLVTQGDGSLTLTLQGTDTWNPRNTVIALEPVTVTWTGDGENVGPGTAAWGTGFDHFTGGFPVASRFRSGDNVNFSGLGASTAVPWMTSFTVGDLSFSGKDYHIQPSGAPVLTLASGRVNVANGITATFHESSPGGPLTLAGTAGLSKTGGGTLVLDLPSNVSGNTLLTAGTLAVRNGALGSEGNLIFEGGTLRLLPGNSQDLSSRIRQSISPVRIDTGGNHIVWATPLHSSNVGGLLKLGTGSLAFAGGTAAISGSITIEDGALKLGAATTGSVTIPNASFESPAYNLQSWAYNPNGTSWTFSAASGTASNNSPWVGTSPAGVQVAFLQNNGIMSTEISANAAGYYRLSLLAANRPNFPSSGLRILLDGIPLAAYQSGHLGRGGDFNRHELPAVYLTAGSHTLAFQGVMEGSGSATLFDDVRFIAAESGMLPTAATLALTGATASFQPGPGSVTLDSLAGIAGSSINLANTDLVITGNNHAATFAGSLTGSGSLTNSGTLRLVGDATLAFTGAFTNTGILDIMTWSGTLPAGFVNQGIVLGRSAVKIDSCRLSGPAFSVSLTTYTGHFYQLQSSENLSGPWQDIGPAHTGNNAPATLTDPTGATATRRFYRVSLNP